MKCHNDDIIINLLHLVAGLYIIFSTVQHQQFFFGQYDKNVDSEPCSQQHVNKQTD